MLASLQILAAHLTRTVLHTVLAVTGARPAFFRQTRYGMDGKPIGGSKFRSMK
ncbi:sugar transferase [Salmonella enterica subsp. enterica]|nr:sugar transferase [Salmonella enterica subsp. enterica]